MRILFVLLIVSLMATFGCEKNELSPGTSSAIIVDSLSVSIVRDETPGFLYPRMRYDFHSVVHLTSPGYISDYECRAADVILGGSCDGPAADPGKLERSDFRSWSSAMHPTGARIPVGVKIGGSFLNREAFSYSTSLLASVGVCYNGLQPERNCVQLTGPAGEAGDPFFSRDGKRVIFYRSKVEGWIRVSLCSVPVSGGLPSTLLDFDRDGWDLGGFTLVDGDSSLLYVSWYPGQHSRILTLHLATNTTDTTIANAFLWDDRPHLVPGTNLFVCLSDPNSSPSHYVDLLLVDRRTGNTEVLVPNVSFFGPFSCDVLPNSRTVGYSVVNYNTTPVSQTIYTIDLDTRQKSVYAQNVPGTTFVWAPNGRDFAVSVWDTIRTENDSYLMLYHDGSPTRITTYPGGIWDFSFDPTSSTIVFSSTRRGETQVWKLAL